MDPNKHSTLLKTCVSRARTTVLTTQTVSEAIARLQHKKTGSSILYIYVVDEEYYLKGVVSTRALLVSDPNKSIESIMKSSIITMREDETLGHAMDAMQKNKLLAVPVVNPEGYFLGLIDLEHYVEQKLDIEQVNRRLNVFQLIGYHLKPKQELGVFKNYFKRMPWIVCNMLGGLICAFISRTYSDVLTQLIILAFFIPLVLTLSESTSMQSLAETLHWIEDKSYKTSILIYRLLKELRTVFLIAVTCGMLMGGSSLFFEHSYLASIILSLSIVSSILCSTLIGAVMPIIFHKMKKDTKAAAGPITLMFADVVSTAIYLTIGWLILI